MKKILLGLSFTALLFSGLSAQDVSGKEIFESKGCAICHKPDIDTIGPSLKSITRVYSGKETELVSYLMGQASPIVDPARAAVMNPQLAKLGSLFEEDIHSLARFIIRSTDRPDI